MKRLLVVAPLAMTLSLGLVLTGCGGGSSSTLPPPPPPSISSFTANSGTITTGTSTALTGVFANGTGVINPGNLPATSGVAVNVSPTATTTYILTVTPASGTAATAVTTVTVASATTSSVTVDLASSGPAVTNKLLGMNMAIWFDVVSNQSAVVSALQSAGITQVRWPGGSDSDLYHWKTDSMCDNGYVDTNDTFTNFVNDIATPANLDVALTANYGSNTACTAGGDPSEAADWATAALAAGVTPSHITVGNEEYGSWEYDLHPIKNDPTTYASSVIGTSGYYSLIKAASPSTLVGVVVDAGNPTNTWDSIVMTNAKGSYDFVEYHYYPEAPGQEDDTFLVQQAAQEFTTNIKTVKQELTTAGEPNTPIYVGEMGSVSSNPGKQSWSITQGLYAGQMLGEMMNDGVSRATWWIGFGNCNGDNGNDSTSLYGWQNFGAYNVFADASGDTGGTNNSACDYGAPMGTMSPTAQAFNLFQNVVVNGEHVLTPTVSGDTTDVRAYAATHSGGTALVLFNTNETTSETVTVTVNGETTSPGVTVITYDKSLYDQTNSVTPVWANPTTTTMGSQAIPLTLTLTPWSMNVVLIQ